MTDQSPAVDLVLIWHHHQPDYRDPRDGKALLPWVRLHGTKDYLDMALRLQRQPKVHATFNFVPSLIDQIEASVAGAPDALFDLLRRPIDALTPEERAEVAARCGAVPRHALDHWTPLRRLRERAAMASRTNGASGDMGDDDLLALECWFLLAWLDPLFLESPEAKTALERSSAFTVAERDVLLALHDRLIGEVIPVYRALAETGQIELSTSPYYHPILPLLIDVQTARRARPETSLPSEPFAAVQDARDQMARALERHVVTFGARPAGMWPPEGSVSPEAAELFAAHGVRWIASDEGVLWQSLTPDARKREALYRPWSFATPAGEVILFFRDHELSDRIGFVYQHWDPERAVADFLERLRRIGREQRGHAPPVVSVILDGENCWEHYPEDGGPFLDGLYAALAEASDIRTRTPSEVIADTSQLAALSRLHSGSWINADFRIWVGHPEKNRAWDLLARARRALIEREARGNLSRGAREALATAEGSDWFWWFGDDHYSSDKTIFDGLFRENLRAIYERGDMTVPGWLEVPISGLVARRGGEHLPLRFVRPTVDGEHTSFYEWHAAGRFRMGAGGTSMHRGAGLCRELYFGFDPEQLYLRLDFAAGAPPGEDVDLVFEVLGPRPESWRVWGLIPGTRPVTWDEGERSASPVDSAVCKIGGILELAIPFATLGLEPGETVEILGHLVRDGQSIETLPPDQLIRFNVPDETFEAAMWSA